MKKMIHQMTSLTHSLTTPLNQEYSISEVQKVEKEDKNVINPEVYINKQMKKETNI